jgi:hypothetical protein
MICCGRSRRRAQLFHQLVADPSYGATYDDLDAAFRALRAEAQLVATQVNRIARRDDGEHLDTGGWCGCWSTPPARPLGCWASPRRSSSPPP